MEKYAAAQRHESESFVDLATLCHDRASRLKVMALITAYGDESSDRDKRILSVSAFIGGADDWTALLTDWVERLDPMNLPNPITAFHMTDCETGQGEFRDKFGWTEQSRKSLIIDLIGIIKKHPVVLFGAGLRLKDYQALELIDGKPVGKSEYHLLLQAIMCELSLQLEDHNVPHYEEVAYFFDQNQEHSFWAQEIHKETKADSRIAWRHRIGSLTFADKRRIRLLQVADLGAYEVMRYITNQLFSTGKPRKSFSELASAGRVGKIMIYDGQTLRQIVEKKKEELAASLS